MNKLLCWTIFVFLVAFAITDNAEGREAMPMEECIELGLKYQANPFGMTIAELDGLRLCVVELMKLKQQEEKPVARRRTAVDEAW